MGSSGGDAPSCGGSGGGQFLLQLLQNPPSEARDPFFSTPNHLPFAPPGFNHLPPSHHLTPPPPPTNPSPNYPSSDFNHPSSEFNRFGLNPNQTQTRSAKFGGFGNGDGDGQRVNGSDLEFRPPRNQNGLGNQKQSNRAVAPPPGFSNSSNRFSSHQNLEGGSSTNRNWKYNAHNQAPGNRINHSLSANAVRDMLETGSSYRKMRESGSNSQGYLDDLEDRMASALQIDEGSEGKSSKDKGKGSRDKDYRSDKRGQWILGQRIRIMKRQTLCRRDIDRLNGPFLEIYKLLIPPEEEKKKQEKLLTLLGSLVKNEWPEAQLHVYGSCANSFGFSKSDIDICLVIQNIDDNKSEILLKLAETLELNKFQNVQALTRARVPIVKLMDPDTGISCDVCINNILAVVNTKLLRDYARIDGRLRQLAFIVKHWAKRRGVNETYQGTLSSYAYVLMCINFLQQCKPAILPCLQGMEPTYSVTVENRECAYFNDVDKLYGFGARNGETIGQLVWGFFTYWAYCHDYTSDVISVRNGCTLSKQAKDWTRRIGNDRHLICIEDPFEITHDLGRVVDKASIRVLREEFERAAEIMQHDSDPCTKLFEPYVPS